MRGTLSYDSEVIQRSIETDLKIEKKKENYTQRTVSSPVELRTGQLVVTRKLRATLLLILSFSIGLG